VAVMHPKSTHIIIIIIIIIVIISNSSAETTSHNERCDRSFKAKLAKTNFDVQVLHCHHRRRTPRLPPPPVNFRNGFPCSRRRPRVASRHPPRSCQASGNL
jgi:hypothetical protein